MTEALCVQSLPQPWPRWPKCLLFTSINGCRAGWGCPCLFSFRGWFEWPDHQEWLGSTDTNRHGVATFDFSTVFGCDLLVVCQTHARGETLDLLVTKVPDLARAAVVAPIGNSDYSSLSAVISIAQAVPNVCVSSKVFLRKISQLEYCLWWNTGSALG